MAKRVEAPTSSRGKIKIRYFEIDVDGDTESIQDGLKALTTALNRPVSNVTSRVLAPAKTPTLLESSNDSFEPLDEDDVAEEIQEDLTPAAPIAKRSPRPKSAPPTPKILDELDFETPAVPWKEFAKTKNPDSDMQKITVAATWFKRYGHLDQITIHHAYTAYKFAGWSTPNDIGQCFRNAKRSHDWFKTDGAGNWEINIIGLNHVEDKMGKGAD